MGIFDIFSNDDAQNAAAAQKAGLTAGYGQLSGLFGQGRDALNTNYAAGLQPFTQNYNTATAGTDQLSALLGLKPGQNPQDVLSTLPGYKFALDQGAQNVMRNQSATGQLNSGKTNVDLQNQGQGVASQNYFNYANQLQPFLGAANSAAGGIAGVNTGLGQGLNNSLMTQGNAAYGTQAGIGNAQAQADYTQLAQSAGVFGGLTGLASSALKLSDARAKDDIEPVGELFDGQPVFRYRYKGTARHEIGLIAQRVEEREPGAVREFPGTRVKGVDYRRATDMAADLGRFLKAA
jgi:hypothetical protein